MKLVRNINVFVRIAAIIFVFTPVNFSKAAETFDTRPHFSTAPPSGNFFFDGRASPPLKAGDPNEEAWSFAITYPKKESISVGLNFEFSTIEKWHVEISGLDKYENEVIYDTITAEDAASLGGQQWWSRPVNGATLWVRVRGNAGNLSVSVVGYYVFNKPLRVERPVGEDDLKAFGTENAQELQSLLPYSDSVTLLIFTTKKRGRYPCTGFRVAVEWILTANHCLKKNLVSIQAEFFFENDKSVVTVPVRIPTGKSKKINRDLDFAFLKLLAPGKISNTMSLKLAPSKIKANKKLASIQHPVMPGTSAPAFKHGVARDCYIDEKQTFPGWFYHHCDTYPGSSGSPILDDGEVVGMHLNSWSETPDAVPLNYGVTVFEVLKHLCRRDMELLASLNVSEKDKWIKNHCTKS